MRKPGVLVIHNRYRQAGGEDVMVRAEADLLRQHGHRVTEFMRENRAIDEMGVFRKSALFFGATWNQAVYRQLRELIQRELPVVAHCHNLVPLISPSAYHACQEESVPVVQTLHNFRMRCPAGTMFRNGSACGDCGGQFARAVMNGCYRGSRAQTAAVAMMLAAHRALGSYERMVDAYSAPSAFCAEVMAEAGIPKEKIRVRPNYLLRDPGARNGSGEFALFVGRVCEEKGIRQLLRAWQRVPQIPLVIVGDGPLHKEAQRMTGLQVMFTGALDGEETLAKIKQARFLVFPSVGYETFGLAALQAGACGVATIGSRLGAIPELVQDGRTGLLFDPHNITEMMDKISWAWAHPAQMDEMGTAARRRYLRRFTAERAYDELSALYSSVSSAWQAAMAPSCAVA